MATQAAREQRYLQEHLAPLASLDCSITEPIGERPDGSRCDTPTLSGYFECDQLSDMVDDSLFELTAAGCLSSSVFARAQTATMDLAGEQEAAADTAQALSAAELLAHRQPYDYSSSSAIPKRRNHKPRAAQSASARQQQQQQRRTRRSGQQPEAREESHFRPHGSQPGGHLCAQCREQRAESQSKQRRRGLFGLFGLFGPDTSGHNNNGGGQDKGKWDDNNGQPCVHLQQRLGLGKPADTSGANRANHQQEQEVLVAAPRRSSSSARIKSRDSIRLTNQRKQRSSNNNNNGPQPIKLSSSHHDNLGGGELLLDLSQPSRDTALRSSQSSYSLAGARGRQNIVDRRPTKSVKFTDQVLVGPLQQAPVASQTPAISLQPIIKRPQQHQLLIKSSSYSQTESSKNLDALLAKYEGNEALVKEINEKLRLTETIASPRSALDVGQEEVVIERSALYSKQQTAAVAFEEPQLIQPTDASLMSCCDPNKHQAPITSAASTTTIEPLDTVARIGQQARPKQAQQRLQRPAKPRQARCKKHKDCDPDINDNGNIRTSSSSDSDDNDDDSASSSSAPSDAGFSKDWLSKQRALGV